jgi:hypothetical protein
MSIRHTKCKAQIRSSDNKQTDLHIIHFCLRTSKTPATAIIREQDDTIPIMQRTLTMFSFRAGNISSARSTSTFGILAARNSRFSCNTTSLSHIMLCWLGKKMVYMDADMISQL